MEIIPAIDIIGGKCVRLFKGNFELKKVYSDFPLKTARIFEKAGIKKLHLIDLEGTKEARIKNWETISKIAKNTNLEIEFGGGIQSERDIKKLLKLGVSKVILGSLILKRPKEFKKILNKFGEKIIVALDIRRDKICYKGWLEESKKELSSFLESLIKLGVRTIICTDIERDGVLKGPNFSLYKSLVKKFPNFEIIAAGGIRNKEDLKKLSRIGIQGVIVGKAVYEKKIRISDFKNFYPVLQKRPRT